MANDNETVEQVYEEMKEVTGIRRFIDSHYCNHCGDQIDGEGSALDVYADRILAAHKREIASKDAEIARLRECLREATEWACGNPDESCEECVAHGGDTPCKCEKWRKAMEGGAE